MRRAVRIMRRLATLVVAGAVAAVYAPVAGNATAAVAAGVTVGGVDVSGLGWSPARRALVDSVNRPVRFSLGNRSWSVAAERFGTTADVDEALTAALTAPRATAVPLRVGVSRPLVRRYADSIAAEVDTPARDARLEGLAGLRPVYVGERAGRELDRARLVQRIERALRSNDRKRIPIRLRPVQPEVRLADLPPVVVIRRESKQLALYQLTSLVRTFKIATGAREFPTPLGRFAIVDMQRNPWWRPPPSDWAKDAEPIPPGPDNPLGSRWMGLDRYMVGIHGTSNAASIGTPASHGCVRMYTWDAEWLFDRVRWGTPVFIVSA